MSRNDSEETRRRRSVILSFGTLLDGVKDTHSNTRRGPDIGSVAKRRTMDDNPFYIGNLSSMSDSLLLKQIHQYRQELVALQGYDSDVMARTSAQMEDAIGALEVEARERGLITNFPD